MLSTVQWVIGNSRWLAFGRMLPIAAEAKLGWVGTGVTRRNCQQPLGLEASRSEALAYLAGVAANSASAIDSTLLAFGAGGRCTLWHGPLRRAKMARLCISPLGPPAKPLPASSAAPRAP
jgi:hypothetical protein